MDKYLVRDYKKILSFPVELLILFIFCIPTITHANINLINPNGGESLMFEQTYKITWSGGSDKIDITIDNCIDTLGNQGLFCYGLKTPIALGIDNKGYYDWTVKHMASRPAYKYKLAIANSNATTSDEVSSANPFYISKPPKLSFYMNPSTEDPLTGVTNVDLTHIQDLNLKHIAINYKTENTIKCEASGDWSGPRPAFDYPYITSQEDLTNFQKNTGTYVLTCSNHSGSVSKTLIVRYRTPPPTPNPQNTLNISDTSVPTIITPHQTESSATKPSLRPQSISSTTETIIQLPSMPETKTPSILQINSSDATSTSKIIEKKPKTISISPTTSPATPQITHINQIPTSTDPVSIPQKNPGFYSRLKNLMGKLLNLF